MSPGARRRRAAKRRKAGKTRAERITRREMHQAFAAAQHPQVRCTWTINGKTVTFPPAFTEPPRNTVNPGFDFSFDVEEELPPVDWSRLQRISIGAGADIYMFSPHRVFDLIERSIVEMPPRHAMSGFAWLAAMLARMEPPPNDAAESIRYAYDFLHGNSQPKPGR